MDRLRALMLLSECDGDEIWSVDFCRQRRIPEAWIDELTDGFESGFRSDRETIYDEHGVVNQYEGVMALDLACKLGEYLGVRTASIRERYRTRSAIVRAIREAIEDGE